MNKIFPQLEGFNRTLHARTGGVSDHPITWIAMALVFYFLLDSANMPLLAVGFGTYCLFCGIMTFCVYHRKAK